MKIYKFIAVSFLILTVSVLLFSLWNFQMFGEIRWVNNQKRALKYWMLSYKVGSGSLMSLRLRAMAKALKEGKSDYTFSYSGPAGPPTQK